MHFSHFCSHKIRKGQKKVLSFDLKVDNDDVDRVDVTSGGRLFHVL